MDSAAIPGTRSQVRERGSPVAANRTTARMLTAVAAFCAAAGATTLNAPNGSADPLNDFKSPSGNIYCQMGVGSDGLAYVGCEGGGTQAGPKPACAEHMAWGDRFTMAQGQAPESHCHTDTIASNRAQAPVLAYGQTNSFGTITCDSETTGLTCTDASTGHFFTMAREGNTLG